MSKRRKKRRLPFSISLPATKMNETASNPGPSGNDKEEQETMGNYTSIVDSGIRWLLVLAFIILVLIAIEEISVVVFGRQPSQNFTPTLISALTAIIGGILFFFRVLVKHYRNNHRDSGEE